MEATYRYKQSEIVKAVDVGVAKRAVNLTLDTYGPYHLRYSRNGRHMVLGGSKGHLAVVDWNTLKLTAEFHVGETVRDVTFLHNQGMFAVAQKKYAYIYDSTGMEIHCMKNHMQPLALEFLPYHFLLASIGNSGYLKYQDVSTGALVAEHRTKLGDCNVMRQNPWNAVLACGHANGTVTMWTPNMSTPVAKMLVHRGPVSALAIDSGGRYLISAGADARVKVWDIRKFQDEPIFNYFTPTPATTIDVSQRGLVAIGYGSHVQVWGRDFGLEMSPESLSAPIALPSDVAAAAAGKLHAASKAKGGAGDEVDSDSDGEGDAEVFKPGKRPTLKLPKQLSKAFAPYMRHELPGRSALSVRFRPFDDILCVGHSTGISSLVVPGAGEPNYDTLEADPFQAQKARKEAEVHSLLDKLDPTTITLDPTSIGKVDRAAPDVRAKEKAAEDAARKAKAASLEKQKKKTRGRSKSERKRNKKNANVMTAERMALLEKRVEEKTAERDAAAAVAAAEPDTGTKSALSRFYKRAT